MMDDKRDSTLAGPLPYNGWDLTRRERRGSSFDREQKLGGQIITYRFNAQGFRGPEFDPGARFKVFVFGCSHSYGYGISEQERWTDQLVQLLCRRRGIDRNDISLVNFAEPGASTDYIARVLLSQCSRIKPDLVLLNLPATIRTELHGADQVFDIGHWMKVREYLDDMRGRIPTPDLRAKFEDAVVRAKAYHEFASPLQNAMALIKNLLLVQFYCQAAGIDAIASVNSLNLTLELAQQSREVFDPLIATIDPAFVCDFSIDDMGEGRHLPDDPFHFDGETHRAFAQKMLRFFEDHPRLGTLGARSNAMIRRFDATGPDPAHYPALVDEATRSNERTGKSIFSRFKLRASGRAKDDPNTYPLF